MDFNLSDRQREWLDRVRSFMNTHVRPAVPIYKQQDAAGERWKVIPILEDLKKKAKAEGLWNMFMPPSSHEDDEFRGAGLSNLEYALLAEEMGHISWASEVFNCSAPDTGNMEVFMRYGSKEHKRQWLKPLMNGEIRSAFLMTEPAVASSDATNIETSIKRDGDHYVINGRKWWSSGVGDPRCKIAIVMGKSDPKAPKHKQQSMILVPMDASGMTVVRNLQVFGYDDHEHGGHAELEFTDVRVPAANLIGAEGDGFAIAQARLGPGRIHPCMRAIGIAEQAVELMCRRALDRTAFGKPLAEQGVIRTWIAEARVRIEQLRLLVLKTAWLMDTAGNKGAHTEIQAIKIATPEAVEWILDKAIQVHGAGGLSQDFPLAAQFSGIRTLRFADGPDEVHKNSLARAELKRYAPRSAN